MTMEIISMQLTTPQKVRFFFSGVNVFINILQQCTVALGQCPCTVSFIIIHVIITFYIILCLSALRASRSDS